MGEAYNEGRQAGKEGWDSSYNPYPRKSQEAASWERGRLVEKRKLNYKKDHNEKTN